MLQFQRRRGSFVSAPSALLHLFSINLRRVDRDRTCRHGFVQPEVPKGGSGNLPHRIPLSFPVLVDGRGE